MSQKKRQKRQKEPTRAVAYLRTSSAANVGTDKDSEKRQRDAIEGFANSAGFELVDEFFDAAVSGADPLEIRAGFSSLLDKIEGNSVRVVLVEDASRLARDLVVQELGILTLIKRGVKVFASNGDDLTETDDPMKKAMRQIAGVFAELEKHRLVSKLKAARDRKSAEAGQRIEGRKSVTETKPETVALAKKLRRANPKTGERRSYRQISNMLAQMDPPLLSEAVTPYSATAIKRMVEGPKPKSG